MKHTHEELRALCDAALNERWEATDSGNVVSKGRKNNRGGDALVALVYAHDGADHRFFYQYECDTAKFIAATDPPTVRALLDEIEKLRGALREAINDLDQNYMEINPNNNDHDDVHRINNAMIFTDHVSYNLKQALKGQDDE